MSTETKHYVYILSLYLLPRVYKIGHTTRSAQERAKEIAGGMPFDLEVVGQVEVDGPHVEKALHKHFAPRRYRHEWFWLLGEDIENILNPALVNEQNFEVRGLREGRSEMDERFSAFSALASAEIPAGINDAMGVCSLADVLMRQAFWARCEPEVYEVVRGTYTLSELARLTTRESGEWTTEEQVHKYLCRLSDCGWLRFQALDGRASYSACLGEIRIDFTCRGAS